VKTVLPRSRDRRVPLSAGAWLRLRCRPRVTVFKASARLAGQSEIERNPRARSARLRGHGNSHERHHLPPARRYRPPRPGTDPKRVRRLFGSPPPSDARRGRPRRRAVTRTWRGASSLRKSCVIVIFALALSMAGSMVVANRQVELHALQSQLLQSQSTTPSRWDRIPISPPPVSWRPRPVPCTWSTPSR